MRNRIPVRRGIARAALAGVITMVVLAAGCSTGPSGSSGGGKAASEDTVNFLGFGSEYQQAMEKVIPLFTAKTGIKVRYTPGLSSALLAKAQASKANPAFDVIWASPTTYVQGASQGLFEKLDPAVVTNLAKVDSGDRKPGDFGVVMGNLQMGIMYNAKEFSHAGIPAPKSWKDFWNPALARHVAVNSMDGSFAQIDYPQMAKVWGGSIDNMDPLWAKLKELKPRLAGIANDPANMNTMFQSKRAWICDFSNARTYALAAQTGLPLKFVSPSEGSPAFEQPMAVIRNAPHPTAAQKFVNFMLTPEAQKIFAKELFLRPVIDGLDLPKGIATKTGYSSSGKGTNLVHPDAIKIVKNLDAWSKSFNDAMG